MGDSLVSSFDEVAGAGTTIQAKAADAELEERAVQYEDDIGDAYDMKQYDYTDSYGYRTVIDYDKSKDDVKSDAYIYYRSDDTNQQNCKNEYADVPGIFTALGHMPDPTLLKGLADTVERALPLLAGPNGHTDFVAGTEYDAYEPYRYLDLVATATGAWDGLGAIAFQGWLETTNGRLFNLFDATSSLRGALYAEYDLWDQAQKDAQDLTNKTASALDALYSCDGSSAASWGLAIAGVVVGIAAAPVSLGASGSIIVASATGALSLASKATSSSTDKPVELKTKFDIGGGTAKEVIDSLRREFHDYCGELLNHEMFIETKLSTVTDQVTGTKYANNQYPYTDADALAGFLMPVPGLNKSNDSNVNDRKHFGKPGL